MEHPHRPFDATFLFNAHLILFALTISMHCTRWANAACVSMKSNRRRSLIKDASNIVIVLPFQHSPFLGMVSPVQRPVAVHWEALLLSLLSSCCHLADAVRSRVARLDCCGRWRHSPSLVVRNMATAPLSTDRNSLV